MKGIKCIQLKDVYFGIKYDAKYQIFIPLYNKMNENYRVLVEHKIIKPVSILKMKIKHKDHRNYGNNFGQGSRGRDLFGGRDRGGQSSARGCGRGRQVGQGRGGCCGHVRVVYNVNEGKDHQVELSCLLNNIDLNNLTFDENK